MRVLVLTHKRMFGSNTTDSVYIIGNTCTFNPSRITYPAIDLLAKEEYFIAI